MTSVGGKPPKKSVGGVTYNPEQFRASRLPDGRYQLQAKKSKEIIIFPAQSPTVQTDGENRPRQAEVTLDIENGLYWDDTKYTLSEIDGCEFQSSKRGRSDVNLDNCTNSTVDLSANDTFLFGDNVTTNNHGNNTIILDKHDSAMVHCDPAQYPPDDNRKSNGYCPIKDDGSYEAVYYSHYGKDRRVIKTQD